MKHAAKTAKDKNILNIGGICKFFKDEIKEFKSVWATTLTGQEKFYIISPRLGPQISKSNSSMPLAWLNDKDKAPYIFFSEEGPGSLVDLVTGKHGTTFPRDCSTAAVERNSLPSRTRAGKD